MINVAPCSRQAAEHAVLRWHYSRAMPAGRLITIGVWEHGRFIGAVVFGRGATGNLLKPYGLTQAQGCELVRVALRDHTAPVSKIVADALRIVRTTNPGLRLVVSFADPAHGHHGGIYQAGNWIYLGTTEPAKFHKVRGKLLHDRTVSSMIVTRRTKKPGESRLDWLRRTVDANAHLEAIPGKHRYVYPLDKAMRRRIVKHAKPYPHADEVSTARQPTSGR